ncbi:MAG: M28 family peptidase [Bryobacteraceae bacterium]|nr:M28 family peptidase [Bryobacteraceae bacterium]
MPKYKLLIAAAVAARLLPGQGLAPGNETIRKEELEADLHFLASDAMRGRLTDTPEYFLAAKFIESRFRRMGLRAIGPDGALLQRFHLTWSEMGEGNRLRVSYGPALSTDATLLDEFMPLFFSPGASSRAGMVFAGFGIEAPSLKWSDLNGDVRGRILLVLEGEPKPDDPKSIFDGVVTSIHSDPLRKALRAQAHGAMGILFVNARQQEAGVNPFPRDARNYWPEKPPHLKRFALTSVADRLRIPAASISAALAQQMLGERKLADLLNEAEKEGGGFTPVPLDAEAELTTSVQRRVVDDHNVVAGIEGSDATLKEEAVIVTAHYDHNGTDGALLYAGADDNGSGTVALLEIAEAYALAAQQGARPKRSVIFVALGSEERCCGPLLGAAAWVENPWWPLEKTVAVLNMDMLGRSEEVPENGGSRFRGLPVQTAAENANAVNVIGTSFSPDLRRATQAANRPIDLLLRFRYDNNPSNLLRRSDQWVFLNNSVPALWFHTGLHPDYHTVNDRPERIDYRKVERVARLVHQLSWELAQAEKRPAMLKPRPIPPPD